MATPKAIARPRVITRPRVIAAPKAVSKPSTRQMTLWLGSLVLVAIVAYASTPFNFWVADDFNYLGPKGLDRVLSFFDPTVPTRAFYRPLNWTAWVIDYDLWGKTPFGWHLSSMVFHAITTVVVALLAWRLLNSWGVALFAGALFAMHPSHPETVAWINGRTDLVCGLFYFPAVLFFTLYLQRREEGRSSTGMYLLAFAMAACALLAKEQGVTLPLALLITDAFFFTPPESIRNMAYWRRRLALHAPFIALVGLYVTMRVFLVVAGIVTTVYTGPSVITLRGLLNAVTSNTLLDLGMWGTPVTVPLLAAPLKIAIMLGAIVGAWLLVRWLGRPALYCMVWTIATLLLTFNLSAQRWMYISSFGVCLLGALVFTRIRQISLSSGPVMKGFANALPAVVLALWGMGVMYQNVVWHRAGEEARSILYQIKAYVPDPRVPTTIYFAGAPSLYDTALLFNTGLPGSMSYIFDGGKVELHEVEQPEPDPVIQDALANPPRLKPNALFLGYHVGKVYRYSTLDELLKAGTGKG